MIFLIILLINSQFLTAQNPTTYDNLLDFLYESSSYYDFETTRPDVVVCDSESVAKLDISKNHRNMNMYESKDVFIVESGDWKDVLKATTLSIWKRSSEKCSTYSDADNNLCAYPLLVINYNDVFSPSIFLKQYTAKKVKGYNVSNIASSKDARNGLQTGLKNDGVLSFYSANSYYSFWKSYEFVVVSDDNYVSGIHAAIIASSINAPLVFVDEKEAEVLIANRKIITVSSKGVLSAKPRFKDLFKKASQGIVLELDVSDELSTFECHTKLQAVGAGNGSFYMPMNRKMIIFNPLDLKESCSIGSEVLASNGEFYGIPEESEQWTYCKDSLMTAYLAVARNEHILSIPISYREELFPLPNSGYPVYNYLNPEYRMTTPEYLKLRFPRFYEVIGEASKGWIEDSELRNFSILRPGIERIMLAIELVNNKLNTLPSNFLDYDKTPYITILGSPTAFPFSPLLYSEYNEQTKPDDQTGYSSPVDYMLTFKDENTLHGYGRITGITVSDTSSLVMRGLFLETKNRSVMMIGQYEDIPDQKYVITNIENIKKNFQNTSCYIDTGYMGDPSDICVNLAYTDSDERAVQFRNSDIVSYNGHGSPSYIRNWFEVSDSDFFSFSELKNAVYIVHACSTLDIYGAKDFSVGFALIRQGAKAYYGFNGMSVMTDSIKDFDDILVSGYGEDLFLGDFDYLLYNKQVRSEISGNLSSTIVINTMNTFMFPNEEFSEMQVNYDNILDELNISNLRESIAERRRRIWTDHYSLIGDPLSILVPERQGYNQDKKSVIDIPHRILNTRIHSDYFFSYQKPYTTIYDEIGISLEKIMSVTSGHKLFSRKYPLKSNNTISFNSVVVSHYNLSGKAKLYDVNKTDFNLIKEITMSCKEISPTLPFFETVLYPTDYKNSSSMKLFNCSGSIEPSFVDQNKLYEDFVLFITVEGNGIIKRDFRNLRIINDLLDDSLRDDGSEIIPLFKDDKIFLSQYLGFCTQVNSTETTQEINASVEFYLTGFDINSPLSSPFISENFDILKLKVQIEHPWSINANMDISKYYLDAKDFIKEDFEPEPDYVCFVEYIPIVNTEVDENGSIRIINNTVTIPDEEVLSNLGFFKINVYTTNRTYEDERFFLTYDMGRYVTRWTKTNMPISII